MQAIVPHVPARSRPYAWGSITVDPDPPRVGEMVRIGFPLANPGPDDVVVERIEASVARFGIGVAWEKLPVIGPLRLPADPGHIEHVTVEWVPQEGGHRCVRASIYVKGMAQPCLVGRNLQVVEAAATEEDWRVPFRLGNPERMAAPIVLRLGGNDLTALAGTVLVHGRQVALDEPIWLEPHEEVDAVLVLRARTDSALSHLRTLEGTMFGRLVDGIQVTVRRPAHTVMPPDLAVRPSDAVVPAEALAYAR